MSDDKWNPRDAALTASARDSDALGDFYRQHHVIEKIIRTHEPPSGGACNPLGFNDAITLAKRIRALHLLSHPFDGRDDYRAFLTGRCLALKETAEVHSSEPEVEYITAAAKLESTHREHPRWRIGTLAIPAELELAFGVQSFPWLSSRCEMVVREHVARKHEEQITYAGSFAFTLDPESRSSQPEQGTIRVVLAPVEDAIAMSVEAIETSSSPDHWNALEKAAAMLLRCRQPLGDLLRDWAADALDGRAEMPDGRKSAQWPKNELRDLTIVEAIHALQRCGVRVMMSDRSPGDACNAVGRAFSLSEATILDIWKDRRPR